MWLTVFLFDTEETHYFNKELGSSVVMLMLHFVFSKNYGKLLNLVETAVVDVFNIDRRLTRSTLDLFHFS